LLLLEKVKGEPPRMRTASIFPTDSQPKDEPDKKLVVWRLPVGEPYRGVMIYPKAK
jgi:hypothetical protein